MLLLKTSTTCYIKPAAYACKQHLSILQPCNPQPPFYILPKSPTKLTPELPLRESSQHLASAVGPEPARARTMGFESTFCFLDNCPVDGNRFSDNAARYSTIFCYLGSCVVNGISFQTSHLRYVIRCMHRCFKLIFNISAQNTLFLLMGGVNLCMILHTNPVFFFAVTWGNIVTVTGKSFVDVMVA